MGERPPPVGRPVPASLPRQTTDGSGSGSGHTRQTLVVGRGPAALATAGFLDQAGLDPVLADPARDAPAPAAVVLWRPALALLERLGLRRPVEASGTPLTDLRCVDPLASWSGGAADRPPLAVRRDRLLSLMHRSLEGRIRRTDRPVVSVRPADAGVRAVFEGGISEPFDAVATTERRLRARPPAEDPTRLHWWSFDWPGGIPAPDVATEAWGESSAAFAVPVDGAVRVVLVATDGMPASPLSPAALSEQFGPLSGRLVDALAELDRSALQYGRLPYADPRGLCGDGVALVGPAARASVPGDCLGPTLAVEDGWVLADALAYGPAVVDDALGAYERRRRRRLAAVGAATRDAPVARAGELSGLPHFLCARRTLAFSHLFDVTADLAGDVPDRL